MSDNFTRLQLHPTYVKAQHVAYSVLMVADIAAHYNDALDASELRLARCMMDAFYVHIRLLAEFFVRKTKSGDFGPGDFGLEWVAPDGEASARLGQAWDLASKYVVHFGGPRVPRSLNDVAEFRVNAASFQQLANDALELYSKFVNDVVAITPEWTRGAGALIPDPERDPEGWEARARSDAMRELRSSRDEAMAELGK